VVSYLDLAEPKLERRPFTRQGWIHELKLDGFRILATHSAAGVTLPSRRGTPYHDRFPELIAEMARLALYAGTG
jgi:bifunctional non-homologous end joining protein LigD